MLLTLYRRPHCPLCDHAEEALRGAGIQGHDVVALGWDGALVERYGERIPVLVRQDTGAELDWPFDPWSVRKFLS